MFLLKSEIVQEHFLSLSVKPLNAVLLISSGINEFFLNLLDIPFFQYHTGSLSFLK